MTNVVCGRTALAGSSGLGGATLRGVVVHDREHGAPMAGVELTEARKDFEEGLAIYREFAARAPAIYQPLVHQVEQSLRDLDPVSP